MNFTKPILNPLLLESGRNPKAKIRFLIHQSATLGSGFWLYLYFFKGKK
jgi:hypothetical protein